MICGWSGDKVFLSDSWYLTIIIRVEGGASNLKKSCSNLFTGSLKVRFRQSFLSINFGSFIVRSAQSIFRKDFICFCTLFTCTKAFLSSPVILIISLCCLDLWCSIGVNICVIVQAFNRFSDYWGLGSSILQSKILVFTYPFLCCYTLLADYLVAL